MAMEAIGSVMSVQAQPAAAQKPAVQTEKTAAEYTNANVQAADKADNTTRVVENAGEKGQNGNMGQRSEQQVSDEQIKKAVEQLNKSIMAHSEAIFGIHEGTNRVTIKIVDRDTKKVLKEVPPEKTLDMIAKVWEMAGILIDEKR
ncbi:MAG: flagellar protein FlaG [Bacteroidales bacterium]|nr:flagellar protein FlaG [Lachnoclostridium sp.]MCM1385204.1 flagellar protein FlaG [Lachnoclostridium sp.]MCM1466111.1 flagellar protein FlaG [Bacteroidales bacterium]